MIERKTEVKRSAKPFEPMAEAQELDNTIRQNLEVLGYAE